MPATNPADTLNILEDLAKTARNKGASDYVFAHSDGDELSATVRNGKVESIPGDNVPQVSIQVHMGKRVGTASSTTMHPDALREALDHAISNARYASQDVTKALASPDLLSKEPPRDFQLNDPRETNIEEIIDLARRTEAAALSVNGITNTDGGNAHWVRAVSTYLFSNGFKGQSIQSIYSISASVIGGAGDSMETDYAADSARWFEDLKTPEEVGKLAADRTLAGLNSRQIATMDAPVIFDRRISAGLVSAFINAISGGNLYNKSTYLRRNDLGKQLFPDHIQIIEDPFILRGRASSNTDDIGMARHKMSLVENGILKTWLVGLQTGRKLKMEPNGHTGGVSNVFMAAGAQTPTELMQEMGSGLLVTSMMGHGPDIASGDFSAGASGFWIENGQIAFPVSGITIAGKLQDMFKTIKPADDLDITRSRIAAPSLRIDGLKIGGR